MHVPRAEGRAARESAQWVRAYDDFASIVAGIEEGRIASGDVRKVIFPLVSRGAAEWGPRSWAPPSSPW